MALLLNTRVDMLHLMQPAPFQTAVQRKGTSLLCVHLQRGTCCRHKPYHVPCNDACKR